LTADDLLKLVFVSDPQLSPGGELVAHVRTVIDAETKEYRSTIWLVTATGGEARPFTAGPKADTEPRWSPDGERLAFVSDRSGDRQLWLLERAGGEARQLTAMRHGASCPVWSPDGRQLAFLASCAPDEEFESLLRERTVKEKEEEDKARKDRPTPVTRLKYKADAAFGLLEARHSHLWVLDVPARSDPFSPRPRPRRLTAGSFDVGEPAWAPGGDRLAFAANCLPDADRHPFVQDIHVVPSAGGEPRRLTPSTGPFSSPAWSPDGARILCVGHQMEFDGATLDRLWTIEVETGRLDCLTADFDLSVGDQTVGDVRFGASPVDPVWVEAGQAVIFSASREGANHLFRLELGDRSIRKLTEGPLWIYGFSVDDGGRRAAVGIGTPERAGEVASVDLRDGSLNRLTEVNDWLSREVLLAEPEAFWFPGAGGLRIQGWSMKPVGAMPGKRYPAVLEIHGGPHAMYGHGFFFEFQLLAAEGYGVIFTNPRGSHGYGQEFVHAVVGHYGEGDYADLLAAIDQAASFDWVDGSRLGVTGGSYGGFMTNWMVGHTDRFRAAVTQRSISNWLSFHGVSDIGYFFVERELGSDPLSDPERLSRLSPASYARDITTPLLILHSEHDMRCPMEQAEQLFILLKQLGKETELVRFPASNHELSRGGRPVLRVERLRRIVDWFHRHLGTVPGDYTLPAG
jgi:acylaminoacyl-peptidase